MLDATQIAPTEITTAIPSTFAPNAFSVGVGNLTSTVEGWFGMTTPEASSATAAVANQAPNGTPGAVPVGGSTLLGYIEAPFSWATSEIGAGASDVSGFFSNIGGGVTAAATGISSTLHWLVVGLVAVAVIYLLAQLKVLEGLL